MPGMARAARPRRAQRRRRRLRRQCRLGLQLPNKPSTRDWRVGIIADTESSDEQVAALKTIFTGKDGGPRGAFSGSSSTTWAFRARVTYFDGETPTAAVEGSGRLSFEPFRDMEGKPTMLVDSAFGMARLGMGTGSGHVDAFGVSFDSTWGELSEVEWAS